MQPSSYTKGPFKLSQSSIKEWKDYSPQQWYNRWILNQRPKKTTDSLSFGSLVDTLCFEPEKFDKRFIVSEVKKLSDKVTAIITDIFNHISGLNSNIKELNNAELKEGEQKVLIPYKPVDLSDRNIIDKFTQEHEYYTGKLDQAYNKIMKEGVEYFEFLKKVGNKVVITEDQKKLAEELKNILYTHKTSSGFFTAKKNCRVLFQQPLYADFPIGMENVECIPIKGLLDIIHINDAKRQIREVDLKFTNNAHLFADYNGPVRKFDYTTQHSIYDYLIKEWIKTFEGGKYADYTIMNSLNCVIDDDFKIPYIYEYSQNDLYIKRFGIEGTPIQGWEDVLQTIAWHLDTNQWVYPKEHFLNGRIQINIFNKK